MDAGKRKRGRGLLERATIKRWADGEKGNADIDRMVRKVEKEKQRERMSEKRLKERERKKRGGKEKKVSERLRSRLKCQRGESRKQRAPL